MNFISCPIPGRSLIVQFEATAARVLQEAAMGPATNQAHGLLLGSSSGSDPKLIRVEQTHPVFGMGESPAPGAAKPAPQLVDQSTPMITLGYYTIRNTGASLSPGERDFLATSLPLSASVAMVVTPQPSHRMLAEFYLRDPQGVFGSTPDHRQLLLTQEAPRSSVLRNLLSPAVAAPPLMRADPSVTHDRAHRLWLKLIMAAAILGAVILVTRPPAASPRVRQALTITPPASKPVMPEESLLPAPDFVLPVRSVKDIQDPPEVGVWYPAPAGDSTTSAVAADVRHDLLIRPILSVENKR